MEMINYDARQPWEDLANGIVIRATDDYKQALKDLKKAIKEGWEFKVQNIIAQKIRDLNRWFRGSWYGTLTNVDPNYLIQHLNKEYGNDETTVIINNTVFEKERI